MSTWALRPLVGGLAQRNRLRVDRLAVSRCELMAACYAPSDPAARLDG